MLLPVFASAILSFCFCPLIIQICRKFNLYDEVDPRKIHKGNIPRLGGIAVFSSFLITWLSVRFLFKSVEIGFYASLFVGFGIILCFGFIDDIFNLRAKLKFLVQILAALAVALSPNHFKTILLWNFPRVVGELVTFIWIISIVNAFNLIDGMDWVCGGISFLCCLALGLIFKFQGNNICLLYFIVCGALAGFLFWNKPDAKIFLGDCGSQTLGFLIAVAPLFNDSDQKLKIIQFPVMLLLCSIPLTDVLAAVWRRTREHRKIFAPDRAHIHHKLLNIGFSKPAAIFFLLALQFAMSFAVVVSYFMTVRNGVILLCFCLVFVWGIFITFHYLNRAVNISHKGLLEDHPMEEH